MRARVGSAKTLKTCATDSATSRLRTAGSPAAAAKLDGAPWVCMGNTPPFLLYACTSILAYWHDLHRSTQCPNLTRRTTSTACVAMILSPPGGCNLSRPHQRQPMVARMARVEGHVRAIRTMLAEDRDCPDVLIQLAAVRSALDRVARMVFEDHLDSCIVDAVESGQAETKIAEIKQAFARYFLP